MARLDLSDFGSGLIQPLRPNKPRGVARVEDRRVLGGIFRVLRTGLPWCDLPERYGPSTTVYNRFNIWAKAGSGCGSSRPLPRDRPTACCLSTVPSSPPTGRRWRKKGGADHSPGRSHRGLSRKINAMVDARGRPVALTLSPRPASDKAAVDGLLARDPRPGDVIADRGSRLRCARRAWSHRRAGRAGTHPHPTRPQGATSRRSRPLPNARPDQAVLQHA